MAVTTKLKLSDKDKKILETPLALYEYIKTLYGIEGTEKPGKHPEIMKGISISLPSLEGEQNPDTVWSVHIENNTSKDVYLNGKRLIFGVSWPDPSTAWSRIIAVDSAVHHYAIPIDSKPYARCRHSIVQNNLFETESIRLLTPINVFLKIMEDFLKQY